MAISIPVLAFASLVHVLHHHETWLGSVLGQRFVKYIWFVHICLGAYLVYRFWNDLSWTEHLYLQGFLGVIGIVDLGALICSILKGIRLLISIREWWFGIAESLTNYFVNPSPQHQQPVNPASTVQQQGMHQAANNTTAQVQDVKQESSARPSAQPSSYGSRASQSIQDSPESTGSGQKREAAMTESTVNTNGPGDHITDDTTSDDAADTANDSAPTPRASKESSGSLLHQCERLTKTSDYEEQCGNLTRATRAGRPDCGKHRGRREYV